MTSSKKIEKRDEGRAMDGEGRLQSTTGRATLTMAAATDYGNFARRLPQHDHVYCDPCRVLPWPRHWAL